MKSRFIFIPLATLLLGFVACGEEKTSEENSKESETAEVKKDTTEEIAFSHRNMKVEEFAQYINDPEAEVIDVRTPEEQAETGVLNHARLIDYSSQGFYDKIESEIPKEKSVYVYCQGGGRSAKVSKELIQRGYQNVYNLEYGMEAWLLDSMPVIYTTHK